MQSPLLLSEIFDVTVDSLIKEDVMTMTKTIDSGVRTMKQMAWVMVVFLLLMIAAMAWLVVQTVVWDWDLAYAVPTFVLALVLWCVALCAAVQVERIKRAMIWSRIARSCRIGTVSQLTAIPKRAVASA